MKKAQNKQIYERKYKTNTKKQNKKKLETKTTHHKNKKTTKDPTN